MAASPALCHRKPHRAPASIRPTISKHRLRTLHGGGVQRGWSQVGAMERKKTRVRYPYVLGSEHLMEWIFGFVIAGTVGMTGIGGGSFTVPVLLLFGISATEAVGTAMIYAAVLRVVAAPFYMVQGNVHARYLELLLVGPVPGRLLGTLALYLLRSPSW